MKYFYYTGLVALSFIFLVFVSIIDYLRIGGCPPQESWFSFLAFLSPIIDGGISNYFLNFANIILFPLILIYSVISVPVIGWKWWKHKSFALVKRQFILSILLIISILIFWGLINLLGGTGQLCSSLYPVPIPK